MGPVPASMLIGTHTMDNLVHSWDLARATGQNEDLDPDLAIQMLDMMRQVPFRRGEGFSFQQERPPPADATPVARLAAYFGRVV
jgi:uncharacterized protein (TIGR03086 family)